MDSCVVVPTLTSTEVGTSHSLVTTSIESISTGPASVFTTIFRTCSQLPDASSSHCQVTLTTSLITIPGNTTTVTVPTTLTVDVPVTVLTTLFGTSCTSSPISSSISSTPTSTPITTSTSTSTDTSSTTTSLPIITTPPPPTVITTSSLVTSDGSTFVSYYSSTEPAVTADSQSTGGPSDKRIPPGPIIGGVLGGIAALLLLGLLTWYLVKKETKFSHFLGDNGHSSPHQMEPAYKYGMVGQQSSNPVSLSNPDPSSAAQNALGNGGGTGQAHQAVLGNDAGFSQSAAGGQGVMSSDGGLSQGVMSNDGGLSQGVMSNDGGVGQGVFTNDMGSGQATASGQGIFGDSGLGQATGPTNTVGTDGVAGNLPPISQNPSNPFILPLIAGIGTAAVASGVYATASSSSRPSSSRPSTASSQALGPLVTPAKPQGSYPPALQNWNAIHGYGQAHAGPSTSSNNNNNNNTGDELGRRATLSHGSPASSFSAYSHSSWVGNSPTGYRASDDTGAPSMLPSMGTVAHNPQQQYQQHPQNSFGRVPSLQVTNNEYRPYAETSSSSFSAGASSSQRAAPVYDGKGRPVNMPPEKAPLVHLDGSLYQQPPRGPRSGTEPPAYIE